MVNELEQRKRSTIIFLSALSLITLWVCYLIARPFLKPVFFAVVLAIVFHPLHLRISRFIRQANLAALCSTLCALLTITIPAFLIGAGLRRELKSAYLSLSGGTQAENKFIPNLIQLVDKARMWLGQYVDLSHIDLRAELLDRLQQLSTELLSQVAGVAGGVTSFVISAVISFLTLFYLFRDGRALWTRLSTLIPLDPLQLEKLTTGVWHTINASMYGGLAVAAAQGLLLGMGFLLLGLPSPVLWGLTTAVVSLVPLIGSGIVWFPAAIILIINGQILKGVILMAWGAGVVGLADNVVRPLVISERMHFHPLYVLFSLLGGVQTFGLIGLFIGPVALALAQGLFTLISELMQPQDDS